MYDYGILHNIHVYWLLQTVQCKKENFILFHFIFSLPRAIILFVYDKELMVNGKMVVRLILLSFFSSFILHFEHFFFVIIIMHLWLLGINAQNNNSFDLMDECNELALTYFCCCSCCC